MATPKAPSTRDLLIADLHRTRIPVAASPQDLLSHLRACVEAMEMQMGRESGSLHINQPTAIAIWNKALEPAKAAIAYHLERANDQVIDLDAEAWAALKDSIEKSPRFQEMYAAGGTFTDACSNVRSWLDEEVSPEASPAP